MNSPEDCLYYILPPFNIFYVENKNSCTDRTWIRILFIGVIECDVSEENIVSVGVWKTVLNNLQFVS